MEAGLVRRDRRDSRTVVLTNAVTNWRRVAPIALWYSLTLATGICSPEILAALMKPAPGGLGLSLSTAGVLLTVEMIANGAFGLSARLFDRYSSRTLIVTGFLATLFADVATAGVSGLGPLIALRVVAGAGLGVVTIAVSRFVAAAENPDRLSSLLLVTSTILSGAVLIAFGNSSPSVIAVFLTLAGLAVLGLATTALSAGSYAQATVVETPRSADTPAALAQLPGLFLIAAAGLLNTADNGLYALTSVIGEHAGVGETLLGYILTGAMVAGVVAAVAAGRLRSAAGRSNGMVGSILVKACVAFTFVRMTSAGGFGAMAILSSFTLFFAMPLLLGASAHLDRRGRLVAQVSGALQIGGALGPAWASGLAEVSGMRAVAIVCAALLVVSAFLCLMPLRIVRDLEYAARAT
jgi:MFS transporter, DHA1 family, inner membrane transport protein